MIRSLSDETLAARWDPTPWVGGIYNGILQRSAVKDISHWAFAPRREMIPGPDPLPFTYSDEDGTLWRIWADNGYESVKFAPRPWSELQRLGVTRTVGDANPILVAFRDEERAYASMGPEENQLADFLFWIEQGWQIEDYPATPEQVADARKVLSRLARLVTTTETETSK